MMNFSWLSRHEDSTVDDKRVTTYTKMTRTKLARHPRILRKGSMPEAVKVATEAFLKTKSNTVNLQAFEVYLKERASADIVLGPYYRNETEQVKFKHLDQEIQFEVNQKGYSFFGELLIVRIRGHLSQPQIQSNNLSMFITCLLLV